MQAPYIRIEDSGIAVSLREDVTTIGRGSWVDVRLGDPSVSRLHAEIIRRGPYAYVTDLGLSRNGTRVNGRLVARRVLQDGDVLTFGSARCRVGGLSTEDCAAEVELRRPAAPELTRREADVVTSLCRPALSDEAFVAPSTAREIAADLVVTEAAVKQHLLRLYQKFRIPEGPNRRIRLANEVVALGLVRPLPPTERPDELAATGGLPAVPGLSGACGPAIPPGPSPALPPQSAALPPQSGLQPARPGARPAQPGALPAQPGALPAQPGALPAQPGARPAQPRGARRRGDAGQPGELAAQAYLPTSRRTATRAS